jgi:membrane associated rhomboid family serine protease
MSHIPRESAGGTKPEFDPIPDNGDAPLRAADTELDEIPTISQDMLHHERVEFEAGMKVIPPVTLVLVLACIAVYLRQIWIGGLANRGRVIATGAMDRGAVLSGEIWRTISGGFMHASTEHLIGNVIMLSILGMACEHAFGRGPFLFVYVASCVAGSLAVMIFTTPAVGASGAIFGLAGALIATIYTHRRQIELRDHRVGIVLAIWAIYTLVLGAFDPIVSNSCHLGGLIGGAILGVFLPSALLTDRRELSNRPFTRLETVAAIAALLGTAVFFLPRLK